MIRARMTITSGVRRTAVIAILVCGLQPGDRSPAEGLAADPRPGGDNILAHAAADDEGLRPDFNAGQDETGAQVCRINMVFDQWVLGGQGPDALSAARCRMNLALLEKIIDVDALCGLTEAQQKKLYIAGCGDIHRVFERIEELRRRFQHVLRDHGESIDVTGLDPETALLWSAVRAEPFGAGFLFDKIRAQILTPEQSAKSPQKFPHERKSTPRNPSVHPRQIGIPMHVFEVDRRRPIGQSAEIDRLLGRQPPNLSPASVLSDSLAGLAHADLLPPLTTTCVSVTDHDFRTSPEFTALCENRTLRVLSSPEVRTIDGQSCGCSACVFRSGSAVTSISVTLLATILPGDQIQVRMDLGLGTSRVEPGRFGGERVPAIGVVRIVRIVPAGHHLVLHGLGIASSDANADGPTEVLGDDAHPRLKAVDASPRKELIVILSPVIVKSRDE